MMNKLTKVVAAFEVVGGAIGVVMGIWPLFKVQGAEGTLESKVIYFAICIGFSLLYALSIYAGVELWKQKRIGYVLSIWSQAIQIPLVASPYLIYNFFSAISLSVMMSQFGPSIKFLIGNSFSLGLMRPDTPLVGGINLVALALLIYLVHRLRRVNPL